MLVEASFEVELSSKTLSSLQQLERQCDSRIFIAKLNVSQAISLRQSISFIGSIYLSKSLLSKVSCQDIRDLIDRIVPDTAQFHSIMLYQTNLIARLNVFEAIIDHESRSRATRKFPSIFRSKSESLCLEVEDIRQKSLLLRDKMDVIVKEVVIGFLPY